ncbi:MAG: recombinase family protein [Elainellaceae cyanobacterium]
MKIIAYSYVDLRCETVPNASLQVSFKGSAEEAAWWAIADRVYQDYAELDAATDAAANRRETRQPPGIAHRPQWQQLLQDCQEEPPAAVLVRQLADLGDSVAEVGDRLAELEALHIPLRVLGCDPQTPAPSPAELLQQFQTLQAAQRRQRIQQGHARNRIRAQPPPGKAPYGYRRGKDRYLLDRTTAPVVKDFFDHFLLYGSLRGSIRYLQQKYNKKISSSTGKRWLTSPVYRGDLEYHTGDVVPDTHPAILPRAEAAQVDRILWRNRKLPPRAASAPRSLSGLVVCGECQSPLRVCSVTRPRQSQSYLYLRPAACPRAKKCGAIAYDAVLHATFDRICEDLPRLVSGTPLPDVEQIQQAIARQITTRQTWLAQLPDLVQQGILDLQTADLRAYTLRTETARLQTQLDQLPPANLGAIAQVISLPQFWLDLSESERRAYFREFLQQIVLEREAEAWRVRLVFLLERPNG